MAYVAFKGIIINFLSEKDIEIFPNWYLIIDENGRIDDIRPDFKGYFFDYENYLILPGFIDLHSHVPQVDCVGYYAEGLLDWLNKYIFKAENNFANPEIARIKSKKFFLRLLQNGITTCVCYSSIHKKSTDIVFEEAYSLGLRAFIGKTIMDKNLENGEKAIKESIELYEKWNGRDGRLFYVFTPRFLLSSTKENLTKLSSVAKKLNAFIQTHLSENKKEVEEVYKEYGKSYTEVLEEVGLLTDKTILAHCIHLEEKEWEILKKYNSAIVHCPSSNFFLHSGKFKLNKAKNYGLKIGLGLDIGAGDTFSMFDLIRTAYYTNFTDPLEYFYYATYASAKILKIDDKIGTLEKGKEADFIIVNQKVNLNDKENIKELLRHLPFTRPEIKEVYVRGKLVFEKM